MTIGLLLTALALGVRHGVDWDHIAAITDLTSSSETRRRGFVLSLLYALGHAVVVFALGGVAILFGSALPSGVDVWMGRIVGVTLVLLGVWVLVQLTRHGRDFRLRSRWMLVVHGTFAGIRRVRMARQGRTIDVDHEHEHDHGHELEHTTGDVVRHEHAHVAATDVAVPVLVGAQSNDRWWGRFVSHRHTHHHELALPADPFSSYGGKTATGIGVLHGVGVESPTQIAVFVAATSVGGTGSGLALLTAWVVGLILANAALALLAGFGVLHAERSFTLYATIAVVVAIGSIAIGALLLFGFDALPELLV